MKNFLSSPFIFVCTFLFVFLISLSLSGQEKESTFWDGWSVQANGGLSLFYGDIETYTFYKVPKKNNEYKPGYGLILQKQFSPVFTLRGQLYHGYLSGTKRKQSIWFEGDVIETSLSGKLDVLNLFFGHKDRKVSMYIMSGIGWANWQTELKQLRTNIILDDNGKNKTGSGLFGRTLEPVIPFGGGFDFRLSPHVTLNVEGSLRPVKSDKLDAKVGKVKYDFYSYNFVGLSYQFGTAKEISLPVEPNQELAEQKEADSVEVAIEVPVEVPTEVPVETLEEPIKEEVVVVPPVKLDKEKSLEENIITAESKTGIYETPWPGVEFTVQIAASKSIADPVVFQKKFNLNGEVDVHHADDWNRYSIGRFIKYWQAREYRNILATRNTIEDAFVVAYKDGQRMMLTDLFNSFALSDVKGQLKEERSPQSHISFAVQVLATRDGNIPSRAIRELYEIDMPVYKELIDGWYEYATGSFESYSEAAKVRNKLKARGISGAFVIGYKDGLRVKDLQSIMP